MLKTSSKTKPHISHNFLNVTKIHQPSHWTTNHFFINFISHLYNPSSLYFFFQAYVRHPELAAAKANRDYIMKLVFDAVNTISGVAQSTGQSDSPPDGTGELAAALDEFDVSLFRY